jgi:Synaptic plasticity regulator PANTS-like
MTGTEEEYVAGVGAHTLPPNIEDLHCSKYFKAYSACRTPNGMYRHFYRWGEILDCSRESMHLRKCFEINMLKARSEARAQEKLDEARRESQRMRRRHTPEKFVPVWEERKLPPPEFREENHRVPQMKVDVSPGEGGK